LEGQESYTKIYLLTLLYTNKLQEGSLDVDGYVKSMGAIWRKLNEVNEKLPEEPRRPHDSYGSCPIFRAPKQISEMSKGPLLGDHQERPVIRSFKAQS
jgi:hypothetical protein